MGRVVYEGKVIEAVELDVVGEPTRTVEFPMSDGSKLVIRFTVVRSWRAKDTFNDVGEPIYGAETSMARQVRDIPQEFYGKPLRVRANDERSFFESWFHDELRKSVAEDREILEALALSNLLNLALR